MSRARTALGLGLLALVTVGPLLAHTAPTAFFAPSPEPFHDVTARVAVLLGMAVVLGARAALDRRAEPGAVFHALLFAVLAGALTAVHWAVVDRDPARASWQRDTYLHVLDRTGDAPHPYRPLPYGFVRLLEWCTRDWLFACLAYRWFFTWWFIWACFRFARLFHPPGRALLTLVPLVLLYPASVLFYHGQLTDPLSHALFVLALVYLVEDRPWALAGALALGVLAKETVLIVVPAYLACHRRQGWRAVGASAGLAAVGILAFLAPRSLDWRPGYGTINGTGGLMVGTNLGVGTPVAWTSVPLYHNYLHPLLFVGTFLPAVAANWRRTDPRVRALFLTLTPLLLASNLCFGWMYESRNYMPLVPLLAAVALSPARPQTND